MTLCSCISPFSILEYTFLGGYAKTPTRKLFDNNSAVIIDVRDALDYAEVHIPGALSNPLEELQSRYQELPPDAEIITYCT